MGNRAGWQQAIDDGRFWKAAQARAALAAWERSGETVVEFARRNGLGAKRLYWWRHRLKAERSLEEGESKLIPVTVRATAADDRGSHIVVMDGELRIEVGDVEAVSPAWVAALLRMMREGRP